MWELDHKESWAPKNWCFWTVMLEKTLDSRLDCKEIKPVNPKANQSWIFIGRTNAEAEASILWPSDAKKLTHWKRPWCWEGLKAGGEGDDRGWDGWMASHWFNGHESEQALGLGDEQGGLACCSQWGCKELDMTEQLNWRIRHYLSDVVVRVLSTEGEEQEEGEKGRDKPQISNVLIL